MSVLPFTDPFGWYPAEHYGHRHFRWNPFRDIERLNRDLIDEPLDRMMSTVLEARQPLEELGAKIDYNDRGDLNLCYSTSGFRPEEICVDLEGNKLTVSGRHSERQEGVGRQEQRERYFTRMIQLDPALDQSRIECKLNDDGNLCIQVPRHQPLESGVRRQQIPIDVNQREGPRQGVEQLRSQQFDANRSLQDEQIRSGAQPLGRIERSDRHQFPVDENRMREGEMASQRERQAEIAGQGQMASERQRQGGFQNF